MRTILPPGVGNLLIGLFGLLAAGVIIFLGTGRADVAPLVLIPVVVTLLLAFLNIGAWWDKRGKR